MTTPYIHDNWDRMAQFYASLEEGHATASTALKRIVGFTSKNKFYQANLQLARILKTEHILYWMADPHKRKRTRKGLLKVEQIHQLARDITYGNRGRIKGKTLEEITSSGNCTTLIMATIIYWQAKEISQIVDGHNPEEAGVEPSVGRQVGVTAAAFLATVDDPERFRRSSMSAPTLA